MQNSYLVDVPVLLIFWKRYDIFSKTFESIKKAKPSKLLFYQDGPRNNSDLEDINKCRSLIETIDWKCEIFTHFNNKNVGCDPNVYNAIIWAFSIVDKCIILEDDVVPNNDFFNFCQILLDKYENDTRINMICGMNNQEIIDRDTSYIFSRFGSIWGWATWKRVIDQWDSTYSLIKSNHYKDFMYYYKTTSEYDYAIKKMITHSKTNIAYHESINLISQISHYQLNIVPTVNLIKNIGLTSDSTHSSENLKLLIKKQREQYNMEQYPINLPLVHPTTVMQDLSFDEYFRYTRVNKLIDSIKYQLLKIRYLRFDLIMKSIKKKVLKK